MAVNDLGTRIRRARERKRWSQAQLAAAIGVGTRTVGAWERGESEPRNSLGALEELLGDLTSDGQADMYTDPDEAALWRLTAFSEDERRKFIAALREARRERAG